jgi:hypothetical protein
MIRSTARVIACVGLAWLAVAHAQAQTPSAPAAGDAATNLPPSAAGSSDPPTPSPAALQLVAGARDGAFDPEGLRAQIERELALPVRLADRASGSHLLVEASSVSAVRVAFQREDGSTAERTVDVSSVAAHADETLALVAANLMRDEAAVLLAALRAKSEPDRLPPGAAPAPQPTAPAEPPPPKGCDANLLRRRQLGGDVLPYVGVSASDGTEVERALSFNLFGGLTGGVRGFELSGLFSLDAHSVCGLQISGIANLVGGPLEGAQLGLVSWASGRVDGVQLGLLSGTLGTFAGAQFGMIDLAGDDITGAQFAFVNVGGGALTGVQFGYVNVIARQVEGVQLGLVNVSGDTLQGAQIGLSNVASDRVDGTQLGLVNVSAGPMQGFQAGLVNVGAGRVHGAMLGLVNVAEDADAAIGLVNVLWRGRTHLDVWGTDAGLAVLGIEHGSTHVHNITGLGLTFRDDRTVVAPTYGVGVRVVQNTRLFVDVDALGYGLFVYDTAQSKFDFAGIVQLRVPVSLRLTREIALFVAPALNVSLAATEDNLLVDPALYGSARLTDPGADITMRMWPGFSIGARFF